MASLVRSTGDIFLVVAWTLAAGAAVLQFEVGPSLLRTVLLVPLAVVLPGYALLAALYPERPVEDGTVGREPDKETITGVERFVLSVATSVAVVPLLAFALNFTRYGIRLRPLLALVGGVTLLLALVGYAQRITTPVEHRHGLVPQGSLDRYFAVGGSRLSGYGPLEPRTETQRLLNVGLVVALLVLAASVGYAAVTPEGDNEPFTEFYLLTQTDDGEFVAEDLPKQFTAGEGQSLWVAIGNHEGQKVPYTVVVTLDGQELDRFSTSVRAGQTVRLQRTVTPDQTGQRLRLSFLLYRGDVPDDPSPKNAYREARLWVSVGGG